MKTGTLGTRCIQDEHNDPRDEDAIVADNNNNNNNNNVSACLMSLSWAATLEDSGKADGTEKSPSRTQGPARDQPQTPNDAPNGREPEISSLLMLELLLIYAEPKV